MNHPIELINSAEWKFQCEGMKLLRDFIYKHPDAAAKHLIKYATLILDLIPNSHSQVAKEAIDTVGLMCWCLGKRLGVYNCHYVQALLKRFGVANDFLKAAISAALSVIIRFTDVNKTLRVIIAYGVQDGNGRTRALAAEMMTSALREKQSELTEENLREMYQLFVRLKGDAHPDVRHQGRIGCGLLEEAMRSSLLGGHVQRRTNRGSVSKTNGVQLPCSVHVAPQSRNTLKKVLAVNLKLPQIQTPNYIRQMCSQRSCQVHTEEEERLKLPPVNSTPRPPMNLQSERTLNRPLTYYCSRCRASMESASDRIPGNMDYVQRRIHTDRTHASAQTVSLIRRTHSRLPIQVLMAYSFQIDRTPRTSDSSTQTIGALLMLMA
ncbi:hypothetical protein CAPTEDRAFT_185253 [Capitella teleta]|uniref:TOG domain-containing protein n=1 Tax=Capitella teleta TaxID=283909 RepID=R7TA97_CAPTE|nr:hypothetical protein CAPTEDRAFT_185253 [Capitella teleta]|eukprot:ELT88310.1 hypothetical protein CAPTEDRAFT_185253 [Capitella teleta]